MLQTQDLEYWNQLGDMFARCLWVQVAGFLRSILDKGGRPLLAGLLPLLEPAPGRPAQGHGHLTQGHTEMIRDR